MSDIKLLLFDLDGTLLRSDKSISDYSLAVLRKCREKGIAIGVATARGESNAPAILPIIDPDIVISSGGALVRQGENILYTAEFNSDEAEKLVNNIKAICGDDCEITSDTLYGYYANYKEDVADWGEVIPCDFADFRVPSLKICANIHDESKVKDLEATLADSRMLRFTGCDWYQITKSGATKGAAAVGISENLAIPLDNIAAFGDDLVDIDMLRVCGLGVAVENALAEVKKAADAIAECNDTDGVAKYIENFIL